MAEIAGPGSQVTWALTFGLILLPGAVAGGLLGWAEHLRRTGGRRGWRWLALAPLVLGAAAYGRPWALLEVLQDGVGSGAIVVPLFGIAGGYALSGRGPLVARLASGLFALVAIPAWVFVAPMVGPGLGLDTPRGLWVALYFWSLLAVLYVASAIPHLPPVRIDGPLATQR